MKLNPNCRVVRSRDAIEFNMLRGRDGDEGVIVTSRMTRNEGPLNYYCLVTVRWKRREDELEERNGICEDWLENKK